MKPNTVALTIVLIFLSIIAWDVWLYMDSIDRNSISQVIIDATEATALVPWFIGVLMGGLAVHWFEARPKRALLDAAMQELLERRKAMFALSSGATVVWQDKRDGRVIFDGKKLKIYKEERA